MPSGSSGDEGCGFVARLVRFFVQREGQHLHIVGVGLGGASAPLWPVNVDGAARGVPAFLVLDVDQVASPVGIVHAEGEAGFPVLCFQISAGHGRDGTVVDVRAEGFFSVLPPPAPVYLIYLILQLGAVHRLPVGSQGDDVEAVCFVRFDALSFRLVQGDAHVGGEGGVGDALHVNAGVSARLEHAGGECGVQHTRRRGGLGKFQGEGRLAVCIQLAVECLSLLGGELRSGVVEDILSVLWELGVHLAERHFHLGFQAGGGGARQPGGGDGGLHFLLRGL